MSQHLVIKIVRFKGMMMVNFKVKVMVRFKGSKVVRKGLTAHSQRHGRLVTKQPFQPWFASVASNFAEQLLHWSKTENWGVDWSPSWLLLDRTQR